MERQASTKVDLQSPPPEPPTGCIDPFLWRLAREHFTSHGTDDNGRCLRCHTSVPCAGLQSALQGLATAVGELVDAGVQAVDVLPIFLGVGKHLREDLPGLVDALRQARPQVAFTLRPAVGETPELIDLLARIALKN